MIVHIEVDAHGNPVLRPVKDWAITTNLNPGVRPNVSLWIEWAESDADLAADRLEHTQLALTPEQALKLGKHLLGHMQSTFPDIQI